MQIPFVARAKGTFFKKAEYPTLKNVDAALNKLFDEGGASSKLGVPSDGTFTDGLLDFNSQTKIVDAVDHVNEILADLAPEEPGSLNGTDLIGNRTLRVGKVPLGLPLSWYAVVSAGTAIDNIIEFNSTILTTQDPSYRFNRGDEGLLIVKHQEGEVLLTEVATLDIAANFIENAPGVNPPRPSTQDLSLWDVQGDGDEVINARVLMSNGRGYLEVTDVSKYNDFNKWQKMNAQIVASALEEGFNRFVLLHSLTADQETLPYDIYVDLDDTPLSFIQTPEVVESSLTSNKYLSGVRYYDIGDTLGINFEGAGIYKSVYRADRVTRFTLDGVETEQIRNPASIPDVDDTITINEVLAINRADFYTTNARLTAYLEHPWKDTVSSISPAESRLINTYASIFATPTHEYFRDEAYRLNEDVHDIVPVSLIGNWDSSQVLSNGNALIYAQRVQYPNINLSSTLPSNNPNYSTGFSGNQTYLRSFSDNDPHSGTTLVLNSLSVDYIGEVGGGEVGGGDVNVEVKLPGQTGWMDAGKYFASAEFSGADGDGILVSKSGNSLVLTFGTFSTAGSEGVIIVKITFRNTSRYISEMYVNW